MTFEIYYPEQRQMLASAVIRRARFFADDIYQIAVEVRAGVRVGLRDVIARGYPASPYRILDVQQALRLRSTADAVSALLVGEGDYVDKNELMAQHRRRRLFAPVAGRIAMVTSGLVLLQAVTGQVELEAGLNGQVTRVQRDRGAIIEAYGALLQGVWGNGRRVISTLRVEPKAGLEAIITDELDLEYRGAIIVTRSPLTERSLQIMTEQGFAGLIAPSMHAALIAQAQAIAAPIVLTEGFGELRMSPTISQFLDGMEGRQATLDAAISSDGGRPELIVNVLLGTDRPLPPQSSISLQIGMQVRIARADGPSLYGQIVALPRGSMMVESGLKVPCVQVALLTGEKLFVPLANLEITGR